MISPAVSVMNGIAVPRQLAFTGLVLLAETRR